MAGNSKLADLILPAAVLAVVGMMIFPLPRFLLDILLVLNISFALCLLVSVVYIREPEKFTSLPSILLLSTIFRLGLNVSTTRQLLSFGNAPDVITVFGNYVVNGNLIVGVVIFAIVTLVQFMVIAKGAERVAEVAARFALDAMPGKQMSIDADVRSGMIGVSEARLKRMELQQESKLYGALDGAMKFVKGDAIAGLLITTINISAGVLVGISQQDLSLLEALNTYSIFTIGDGLVSQIPALLVAVSAGITVTRVESVESGLMGREIFEQLSKEPQALYATSLVLLCLGFIPGLSLGLFLIFSMIFLFLAERVKSQQYQQEQEKGQELGPPRVFSALKVKFSTPLAQALTQEGKMTPYLRRLKHQLFEKWGVNVPEFQLDISEENNLWELETYVHGIPAGKAQFEPGEAVSEKVHLYLASFVEEKLHRLIDDTQTRMLLEVYTPLAEDSINSLIPDVISVTGLTSILKQLLLEKVSIKEFPVILQAVSEFRMEIKDGNFGAKLSESRANIDVLKKHLHASTLENQAGELGRIYLRQLLIHVRIALTHTICSSLPLKGNKLKVVLLSTELDELLAQSSLSEMPVNPELGEVLAREYLELPSPTPTVILSSEFARQPLARLFRRSVKEVQCIAVSELSEEIDLEICSELSLAGLSEGADTEQAKGEVHAVH